MTDTNARVTRYVDRCPECGAAFLHHSGTSETMVGYGGPDGHEHNDNCRKRNYWCANGHATLLSKQRHCGTPGCEWVGKVTCFCHAGEKMANWPRGIGLSPEIIAEYGVSPDDETEEGDQW